MIARGIVIGVAAALGGVGAYKFAETTSPVVTAVAADKTSAMGWLLPGGVALAVGLLIGLIGGAVGHGKAAGS